MPAIEYQKTGTTGMPWDAGVARKHLKEGEPASYYHKEFAWVNGATDGTHKDDYKFPHHQVSTDGTIGEANIKACQSAIGNLNGGRGGSQIPVADHAAVHAHLAHHLKDAGLEAPELKSSSTPTTQRIQKRTVNITGLKFRAAADGKPATVSGYAAVFNQLSERLWEIGGRREMIAPGAFTDSLAAPDDIRLLINHDANLVLGRNASGTLTLKQDDKGLYFECELGDQSYAKDLAITMARGDVSQCSFAFQINDAADEIHQGESCQVIRSAKVSDVSIVTYPAYPQTEAAVRAVLTVLEDPNVPVSEKTRIRQLLENQPRINKDVKNISGVPETNKDSAELWRAKAASRKRELELLQIL